MSGLEFEEHVLDNDDPDTRAELLLLSSSFLVPKLVHDGVTVWDTMAIGEYLNEVRPEAGLLPDDRRRARALPGGVRRDPLRVREPARRRCPMNLKAHHPDFKVWAGAQADVDRILEVWQQCFDAYGGPFLFGARPTIADAMYAPVCTRFRTYDVELDDAANGYCDTILALPAMREWTAAAHQEPDELEELDVEF